MPVKLSLEEYDRVMDRWREAQKATKEAEAACEQHRAQHGVVAEELVEVLVDAKHHEFRILSRLNR